MATIKKYNFLIVLRVLRKWFVHSFRKFSLYHRDTGKLQLRTKTMEVKGYWDSFLALAGIHFAENEGLCVILASGNICQTAYYAAFWMFWT